MEPKPGTLETPDLTGEPGTQYSGPVVVTALEFNGRTHPLGAAGGPGSAPR